MISSTKGLTLVELLITIAVAAIIITVGVPSMTSLYEASRAEAGIQTLQSSITFARSQAVSYGGRVTVCPLESGACTTNWKKGFTIFLDRNNPQGSLNGDDTIIKVVEGFNDKDFVSFGASFISFTADGLVSGTSGQFAYCPTTKTNEASQAFNVSPSGNLRMETSATITCN